MNDKSGTTNGPFGTILTKHVDRFLQLSPPKPKHVHFRQTKYRFKAQSRSDLRVLRVKKTDKEKQSRKCGPKRLQIKIGNGNFWLYCQGCIKHGNQRHVLCFKRPVAYVKGYTCELDWTGTNSFKPPNIYRNLPSITAKWTLFKCVQICRLRNKEAERP